MKYSFLLFLLTPMGRWVGGIISANAAVACVSNDDCERLLRKGSVCTEEGFCDNPFHHGGCLQRYFEDLGGEDEEVTFPFSDGLPLRTCNSQDPEDAEAKGACVPATFEEYTEIRIAPQNWESAMFYGWIMQIVLSELVGVPTSIDTGGQGGRLNFYDTSNSFSYGKVANNFDALYQANEAPNGDCRNIPGLGSDGVSCAHVLPELWQGNRKVDEDAIERDGNGMVGHVGWYIPKFLVEEEPTLASHWGLRGEANRAKLAKIFKRPTTWGDYCREVSESGCSTDDGVASRAPESEGEEGEYFVSGLYTGHFRATERNDCSNDKNATCTGHIIDYPCTWVAYTKSQLYWNDIALESEINYSYSEMIDVMRAANATGEAAMFVWWYPDAIIEQYDYFHVKLTKTTPTCLENRPEPKTNRCEATSSELIGSEVGSCGYNTHSFETVYASSLRELSMAVPEAVRSPGYQTLRNLRVSDIDISEMMREWVARGVDQYGYDPREVVCSWVAKSITNPIAKKNVMNFIPAGYPRKIQEASFSEPYMIAAAATAGFVLVVIATTFVGIIRFQHTKVMRFAQSSISYQFCFGYFLVAVGAYLHTLVPTAVSCVARFWVVEMGYTIGLVPLLIKVAAINRMMGQARSMRRVTISQNSLYAYSSLAVLVILFYLATWTIIDPPTRIETPSLVSDDLVEIRMECASESQVWLGIFFLWQAVYIFCAAVLAFQSRNIRAEFNDSRELGNMAYCHFLFLVLRSLVWLLPASSTAPNLQEGVSSLLLSADSFFAAVWYFGPKFWVVIRKGDLESEVRISGLMSKRLSSTLSKRMGSSILGKLQPKPADEDPTTSSTIQEMSLSARTTGKDDSLFSCREQAKEFPDDNEDSENNQECFEV